MVKFLGMALVYCPGLTCIKEGWQYNGLVDFQLSIKSDSISFPDICAKSAECYAGLRIKRKSRAVETCRTSVMLPVIFA